MSPWWAHRQVHNKCVCTHASTYPQILANCGTLSHSHTQLYTQNKSICIKTRPLKNNPTYTKANSNTYILMFVHLWTLKNMFTSHAPQMLHSWSDAYATCQMASLFFLHGSLTTEHSTKSTTALTIQNTLLQHMCQKNKIKYYNITSVLN